LHTKALHTRPYDGHTLKTVREETETLTGCRIDKSDVDRGYRGHGDEKRHRIFISGQKRGVTKKIKRALKRRSLVEALIGHTKNSHRLGRHYLKGSEGDCLNAIMSAASVSLCSLRIFGVHAKNSFAWPRGLYFHAAPVLRVLRDVT